MGTGNRVGILFLAALILVLPQLVRNDYYLGVLVFAGINSLVCIGLSLLLGYAGQISLGHAAFYGLGAYTSGLLTVKCGVNPWVAMAAAVLLSSGVAVIIGFPALRLKGHYLAMATLGFGEIIYIIFVAMVDLTGGPSGFGDIPKLSLGGFQLNTDLKFYYFTWAMVFLALLFALNLIHSRVGRALRAIHGSETAAGAMGVNIANYKLQVFVLSAIFASLAGSLYAHYVNFVSPEPFGLMHSVLLLTMVAVGGMHELWGAVLGASLLSILPEFLRFFKDYDVLIYGSILLMIMLFLPNGLFHGLLLIVRAIRNFIARRH